MHAPRTGDGELWTSGSNDAGQLGVKALEVSLVPRRVSALEAHCVHAVACGQGHMLAVVDSGALAAWGSNEFGQLGESCIALLAHCPMSSQGRGEVTRDGTSACGMTFECQMSSHAA